MKDLDLSVFSDVDKENWSILAKKQLKGGDPKEVLNWRNTAGIELTSYYDTSDLSDKEYLSDFFTNIQPHKWKLYQRIEVNQEAEANKKGIEALMGGCDGVIFNVISHPNLDTLLEGIDSSICDLGINGDLNIDPTNFTGPRILPKKGNTLLVKEASNAVKQVIEAVSGINEHTYIFRTALNDFFLEIATIRALKYLLTNNNHQDIHIHSSVPFHHSKEYQWFLNTTSGLASILGGSNSIDLPTAIGDERISRNTANLIREESGIAEYSDQCGGSYYIESLTDRIIKAASLRQN